MLLHQPRDEGDDLLARILSFGKSPQPAQRGQVLDPFLTPRRKLPKSTHCDLIRSGSRSNEEYLKARDEVEVHESPSGSRRAWSVELNDLIFTGTERQAGIAEHSAGRFESAALHFTGAIRSTSCGTKR